MLEIRPFLTILLSVPWHDALQLFWAGGKLIKSVIGGCCCLLAPEVPFSLLTSRGWPSIYWRASTLVLLIATAVYARNLRGSGGRLPWMRLMQSFTGRSSHAEQSDAAVRPPPGTADGRSWGGSSRYGYRSNSPLTQRRESGSRRVQTPALCMFWLPSAAVRQRPTSRFVGFVTF